MASPEVSSNPSEFQKVARAAADLEQTVIAYRKYEELQQELVEAKELAAESAGSGHYWSHPGPNACCALRMQCHCRLHSYMFCM